MMHFTRNSAWAETGFKLSVHSDGMVEISDLNPEQEIRNRMSRWELFRLGLWLVRRSIFAAKAQFQEAAE